MRSEILTQLDKNPDYYMFLRENPTWYKILNRNPLSFNDFIEEMKAAYKLRPQDKIDKILNTLDVINAIMEMK